MDLAIAKAKETGCAWVTATSEIKPLILMC